MRDTVEMTLARRWRKAGVLYVLFLATLATAAALDENGYGFYVAALVATLPVGIVVPPLLFLLVSVVSIAAGVGSDGSNWVSVPLFLLMFGTAAIANAILAVWVSHSARPACVTLRGLFART
jgi:hypothetical protein